MINLERVATFLAVARQGSFREAARHTGLSQPSVTQHVKRLEQSLNVTLIERNNSGSKLTPHGQTFLPYAETLMRSCERIKALFDKTSVAIGASSNAGIYLMQPHLKTFKDLSSCDLNVVIGTNASVADKLQNGEIDVAIMEWWDGRPGFSATPWRREDLVLIVSPQHPWAGKTSIPKDWLTGLDLLGGETGTGTMRLLEQYLGKEAKTIGVSMQLGSTEAVKHAVQAGLGISLVLASTVKQECLGGLLCSIPIEGKPPQKTIFIIERQRGPLVTPASLFVDHLLSRETQVASASEP